MLPARDIRERALFLQRVCGTRAAAEFLKEEGWPLDWALWLLARKPR